MDKRKTDKGDPPPGTTARRLLRAARTATLSTAMGPDGWPYGSLVLCACEPDGNPILLISTLAEHTKNILRDERVSLLVDGTSDLASPLTGARATILGRARKTESENAGARFIARHPDSEGYAGFKDFAFYRIEVERAHLVAGFGRIHWIEASDFIHAEPDAVTSSEAEIIAHMNEDHAEAIGLYANVLLQQPGSGWHMVGCDSEGCDIALDGRLLRLDFDTPAVDAEGVRRELVRLVKLARSRNS